jgi:adenylate kinase
MLGKKTILIFMGPPGSGKGTQTDMLAKKLRIPAISPGELLRQEVKKNTKIGREIKDILSSGVFVNNKIVEKLLEKRLVEKDAQKGIIFDGFPRNYKQTSYLEKKFDNFDKRRYNAWAVYIDISDKEAKKRLTARRVCFCGATYHLITKPPKKKGICDECGRHIEQRLDDRPNIVTKRLKIFHKENNPLLKFFIKKKMVIIVNGEKDIKDIFKDLTDKLKKKGIK